MKKKWRNKGVKAGQTEWRGEWKRREGTEDRDTKYLSNNRLLEERGEKDKGEREASAHSDIEKRNGWRQRKEDEEEECGTRGKYRPCHDKRAPSNFTAASPPRQKEYIRGSHLQNSSLKTLAGAVSMPDLQHKHVEKMKSSSQRRQTAPSAESPSTQETQFQTSATSLFIL